MKKVFADTQYWIAIVKPGDSLAATATAARSLIGEVLTEFLSALSKGEHMRKQAAKMVRAYLKTQT